MGRKVGAAVPLCVEGAGSPSKVAWAEAYFRTEWYPDPSSRFAVIDMDRKVESHIFNRQKFLEGHIP